MISLFSRLKSQTVSTKYLNVAMGETCDPNLVEARFHSSEFGFAAKTKHWDSFIIRKATHVKTNHLGKSAMFDPTYLSPIHYNEEVILECPFSGLTSAVFIVRKIDSSSIAVLFEDKQSNMIRTSYPINSNGECNFILI